MQRGDTNDCRARGVTARPRAYGQGDGRHHRPCSVRRPSSGADGTFHPYRRAARPVQLRRGATGVLDRFRLGRHRKIYNLLSQFVNHIQ